ncbi:MAG: hypothetical protein NT075_37295 [Chloroflexi bacterium]|nr:hypothetical protein [Chloroflexota bacterium]
MKTKSVLIWVGLIFSTLLMAACNTDAEQPTATTAPAATVAATVAVEATATTVATPTLAATATQTATTAITTIQPLTTTPVLTDTKITTITAPVGTPIPDEMAIKEVAAALAATLPITITDTATNATGIEGVKAFKLTTAANSPILWLAYTYGLRNFDPEQNHVLAIYTQGATGWQVVARQELKEEGATDNSAPVPDYLGDGSVTQVNVEPSHLWIQVEGGVGAHSGLYSLFSFDGKVLKAEATGFSSSPGVGSLKDLNGDGIQEVLLDATDYYIFCYACGVRQVQSNILRWDGTQLVAVNLIPLPDSAPTALRTLNEHLITLAQAGLWKDALAQLDEAAKLQTADDATFTWNAAFIRLNAEAKRDVAANTEDAYPLLSQVFYGDYAAAVDVMRKHAAADLFRADTPLIVGTAAEGNEDALVDTIINNTSPALQVQPNLAPAYFLRGWAAYHKDPNSPTALADIKQAAALAPEDTLYSESVDYLAQNASNPTDPQAEEVAAALMATLGITTTGVSTDGMGIQGAYAFKLDTGEGGQPLWLAYTYGLHSFDPEQNHVIAIYTPGDTGWQEVARQELKAQNDGNFPSPDYLGLGSLTQVKVEPDHIWIALEGGAGAHSGVFGLFSFDGATLKLEASSFSSRPGAGSLKDLNGDGIQEVLLDASDYYVFCYACGVQQVQYNILRWDGAKLIPVTLTPLPESAPPALGELNQMAITLVGAGLWKEALTLIQTATPAQATDETFTWNAAYIHLNAEAKRAIIGNANDPYPLLSNLFYGDFVAAVDVMRPDTPAQIFSPSSPLITGTVAAGFENELADTLTKTVDAVLKVRPNLAAAYFLRGWALYLKTQDLAAALPDVKHAAQLAPEDTLYSESVTYLEK